MPSVVLSHATCLEDIGSPGFRDTAPYTHNPVEGARFIERSLAPVTSTRSSEGVASWDCSPP